MSDLKLAVSKKKGEALLKYSDDVFEEILFVFHSNALIPLKNTLHFSLKPGHCILYAKKYDEKGKWVLSDPGYVNYFRPEWEDVDTDKFNTISKQKLLSNGSLMVERNDTRVLFKSKSWNPYHKRRVYFYPSEHKFLFADKYFGRSEIHWNGDNELKNKKKWWNNKEEIYL